MHLTIKVTLQLKLVSFRAKQKGKGENITCSLLTSLCKK